MASRSRALTRPGADPEGRFRPAPTPALVERGAQLQQALAPVQPSAVVRSDAWYGKQREHERTFLPGVWIGIAVTVVVALLILTSV